MMPVTHGSSSGCSSSWVARRANVDRNPSVTKIGPRGTTVWRLASSRSLGRQGGVRGLGEVDDADAR